MKTPVLPPAVLVLALALLAGLAALLLGVPEALAEEAVKAAGAAPDLVPHPVPDPVSDRVSDPASDQDTLKWGYLAAALVTAIGALGAAYAVAVVGAAAVGALAEKPELFGRAIILVGLAEGIAIYGVIIAVLIINSLT